MESTKIGSKLLAHLTQGKEQLIIQDLIANHIKENILTFQYDGATLEVEPSEVEHLVKKLQDNCSNPLETSEVPLKK